MNIYFKCPYCGREIIPISIKQYSLEELRERLKSFNSYEQLFEKYPYNLWDASNHPIGKVKDQLRLFIISCFYEIPSYAMHYREIFLSEEQKKILSLKKKVVFMNKLSQELGMSYYTLKKHLKKIERILEK